MLTYVLEDLIPDACTFYIDEPGEWQEKENGFQQAILECEEILKENLYSGGVFSEKTG